MVKLSFAEIAKERRSVRAFKPKPVEEDILKSILKIATEAPSAGNLQAYDVIIVKNDAAKRAIAEAALGQDFIAQAPVVLVFCANTPRSALKYGERGKLYSLQDATLAAGYAQLAALDFGLATAWVGAFDEAELASLLGLPKGLRPIAIIPLGYPAEKPIKPKRLFSELVHAESFSSSKSFLFP